MFTVFCLIESRPTVAHIVHRAHLVPFLHAVLGCIHLAQTDKLVASEVQRTDVSAEQQRALFSTAAFYVVVRDAAFASGGGGKMFACANLLKMPL